MITTEEPEGKLREAGVERIAEVRVARMESDGKSSVFKYESGPEQPKSPDSDREPRGG